MSTYAIELTPEEAALVQLIELDETKGTYEIFQAQDEPILKLVASLAARDAIPEARRKYWTDPSYQLGRVKASHEGLFERNDCRGNDIYTHPHFLPYLRYFLYGADLPDAVIRSFEEKVRNPKWVTSSDIVPIGKHARSLMKQYHLPRHLAPDEFFKLCIDMGLSVSVASSVRHSAMQAR